MASMLFFRQPKSNTKCYNLSKFCLRKRYCLQDMYAESFIRMQPGGDLQDFWLIFDHVKHVNNWTTMACHVYDSQCYGVMIVAVCDMQSEDYEAQYVM